MNTEMTEKIYNALNGDYQERDYEVEGQYDGVSQERISWKVTRFNHHFPKPKEWGIELNRTQLEALVLIPEDAGAAKIERIYHGGGCVGGLFKPEYTEDALKAIFAAYARKFSEPDDLNSKWWALRVLDTLTEDLPRFKEHKEQVIAGIANSKLESMHDPEELLDVFAYHLQKMELSSDKGVVQAYWQMAKQSPTGYLRSWYSWPIMAGYLLETKPEMLTEFEDIRKNLSKHSLSEILTTMPVNTEAKDFKKDRRIVLPEETWQPILEFVDNAIKRGD